MMNFNTITMHAISAYAIHADIERLFLKLQQKIRYVVVTKYFFVI